MKYFVIAAAVLLAGGGVADAASGTVQTAPKAKDGTNSSTIYCLKLEGTGSRLDTKVCQTAEQWRADGVEVERK
jgi:UDP-N-acetyl-D-mannosaminuronic acid transferase (WecB/TagA/CpsF family)